VITAGAVLFDLDGTLIDSTPAVVRSWTQWAIEYQVPRERFVGFHLHGRPATEIVAHLLADAALTSDQLDKAVRRIVEIESSDTDGVVTFPGVAPLLEALPSDRWAIVTSATRAIAEVRTKAAGITPPALITSDDVRRGKPDPEPFLIGAHRLTVPPGDCLVVEDAPIGLMAARAAGMRTLAVLTTHTEAELSPWADVVVRSLTDVRVEPAAEGVTLHITSA